MKRCLQCHRVEADDALKFCRVDGATLVTNSSSLDSEAGTAQLDSPAGTEIKTSILSHTTDAVMSRGPTATTALPVQLLPSTTRELSTLKRRTSLIVGILITAVVAGAVAIGGYFYLTRKSNRALESIAVLPFENKSGNPDSEYLSDGLAESLIYRLSQLPNLKVSPTSSVFRYKGKETDAQKIGSELGVAAVLSGRIAQRGDSLTISVELVDARNNKVIWGEQYDRKMSDLLATQREIATAITQKLQLKLGEGETKGITKKYTDNNEAYQLYLKGRYYFGKRTKDGIERSIDYYQQAIKLDPNFALAYARIAEAYNQVPSYPYASPKEAIPKAKAAAQQALQIDSTLAEAHTALGNALGVYDWDGAAAEGEFKRAIELDPNSSAAHFRYGQIYLIPMGRFDEAITEIKRGLDGEPLDINMGSTLSWAYLAAGQDEKALEQGKKVYEMEPGHPLASWNLGLVYIVRGMYSEAIPLCEKSLQEYPTNQRMLWNAGYLYAKVGRRDKAEEIINKFRELSKTQYIAACRIASIYGALGEKDKAFAELEKGFAARDWDLYRLKVEPLFAPLRDDPRFRELLKRMNLPVN